MIKGKAKTLGAFYTEDVLAKFLVTRTFNKNFKSILEPSYGGGVFLKFLCEKYQKKIISGYEIDKETYKNTGYHELDVINKDFLFSSKEKKFDLIIGNPPYVRKRKLSKEQKAQCDIIVNDYHSKFQKDYNLFVPFIFHSLNKLNNNGTLAFVLPYDILFIKYFFSIWEILFNNFGKIEIIQSKKRYFEKIQQDTVLLIASTKGGSTKKISFYFGPVLGDLSKRIIPKTKINYKSKSFKYALLDQKEINFLNNKIIPLTNKIEDYLKFNIGYVSGCKEFFNPSPNTISKFNLKKGNLIPSITKNKTLKSIIKTSQIKKHDYDFLYYPKKIWDSDKKYINYGERKNIHKKYKCKVRTPWYKVPDTKCSDFILGCFNQTPKLIYNDSQLIFSNSYLCGNTIGSSNKSDILANWYTSLTILFTELHVHSLGGGMLIFVPNEISEIRTINFQNHSVDYIKKLNKFNNENERFLFGDKQILQNLLNFKNEELNMIYSMISKLRSWRMGVNQNNL